MQVWGNFEQQIVYLPARYIRSKPASERIFEYILFQHPDV
jgi:hypothetical protein